jgi:hypothetical protein
MINNRYLNALIVFCSIFFIHGCASTGFLMAQPEVTMFKEAGTPKSSTDHIDIFYTKKPDRDYEEIAIIEVGDTDDDWSMKQIKIKAREIGADGVIIIGRVGSYGYVTGTGTSTGSFATAAGIGVGEGYGLVAVAIKYK